MHSKASTVEEYLAQLPTDRRATLETVRQTLLSNLDPKGFAEGMSCGMIGYYVPHAVYPPGYHCDPRQPLLFAGLASQKHHLSLYLMCVYSACDGPEGENEHTRWFREAWARTGKKLDMGKACIRFKQADDLALEVIGEAIRRFPAKKFLEMYERSRQRSRGAGGSGSGSKVPRSAAAKPVSPSKATQPKSQPRSKRAGN